MHISLICEEMYRHDLEDIATFMKDLVYLHDRLALLAPYNRDNFRKFENIYFSDYFYRRFSRPLHGPDKLKVARLHLHSPMEIEMILGIALSFPVAAKTFVELIKIIRDWNLDKERKSHENLELHLRNLKMMKELGIDREINLNIEEIAKLIKKDVIRLSRHEIKIKEVVVEDQNEKM